MKYYCYECKCEETYVKSYKHDVFVKGERIVFNSDRRFCKKCNNLIYDPVLDNNALNLGLKLYSEKYGITKERIVELRKSYHLSQELFAKVIGCAKKTLVSYETGNSIPNDSYLIILRTLIDNPKSIFLFISANKEQFSDKEYSRINEKLGELESNIMEVSFDSSEELNEFNGYKRFDKEKFSNIISFFSEGGIFKTKLLKELFYVDFLNYKETCQSMSGIKYSKITHGPVPDRFEYLLADEMLDGNIEIVDKFCGQFEGSEIKAIHKFDKSLFTKDELDRLNRVKEKFKSFSSKQIAEYSHKEKAYIETEFKDYISYDYAFDIDLN